VEGPGHYDARGVECVPYDLNQYLARFGPDAAIPDYAAFAAAVAGQDPFGRKGVLGYMHQLPAFTACLADPTRPPQLDEFVAARTAYLDIFATVFAAERLDALVFPQMRDELGPLHGTETIHETTVCEINIAGLPGVTVPAGYYASGAPFNLIFVGPMWSEAQLLSLAYAYECATRHRRPPALAAGPPHR
jgi:aspartyl-tRNA(Asn)/glutamyl-tRNA(Gln) amidotransferase subunit A